MQEANKKKEDKKQIRREKTESKVKQNINMKEQKEKI